MVVILQNHTTTRAESLPLRPKIDSFVTALTAMRVPNSLLEVAVIIVEVRYMINHGQYGGRNNNAFRINLANWVLLKNPIETSRVVVHELKHLATPVLKPGQPEDQIWIDSFHFTKPSLRWEEVNCTR